MSEHQQPAVPSRYTLAILLFEGFDLLQVSAAISLFHALPEKFEILLISESGESVASQQQIVLNADLSYQALMAYDILYVPGGSGIDTVTGNDRLISWLAKQCRHDTLVCSSCLGAALLAQAGLLENHTATTNKQHFHWVTQFGKQVNWRPVARWTQDKRVFTSSGGTACLDMFIAIIAEFLNEETARKLAINLEYLWINDPEDDPFAPLHIVE
ncbi:dimethyladenosine transferase [Photobacterium gaetbulicola]|uniref:Dimethyladenosine transferase n=1 Tax=Photobacterium gaetbulicola TaxID=1295392 RepID=A0A0B9G5H5_9GAMM|nr:DJ-1/PfpI family protein [Photobacterium gaetbulicola]KHT63859.1 dimethyladenosine transferase [Photobacterium gaetbulicola]